MTGSEQEGFQRWYAALDSSATGDGLVREWLDLPDGITPTGLVGGPGFAAARAGDARLVGLEDASVDAVTCLDSLQLAEPLAAALDQCRRVLAVAAAPPAGG